MSIEDDVEEIDAGQEAEQDNQPPARDWSEDDEAEARVYGWKSPDEWKGDRPEGFIEDPREFIDNSPVARKAKERERERERKTEERFAKLENVYQEAMKQQREAHKAQLEDIKAQQRKAVEEGDVEAYDRLTQQAEKLGQAPSEEKSGDKADNGAAWEKPLQEFAANNDWFTNDPVMRAAAERIHVEALEKGITDPDTNLAHVKRKMQDYFPDKFETEKPKRKKSAVEGEGLALGGGKKDGFESLDKEAKSAFKMMVSEGIFEDTAEGRQKYYDLYRDAG